MIYRRPCHLFCRYCERPFAWVSPDASAPPQLFRRIHLTMPVAVAASLTAANFAIRRCGGSALTTLMVSDPGSDLTTGRPRNVGDSGPSADDTLDKAETHFLLTFVVTNETADAFDTTVVYDDNVVRQTTLQGYCAARVCVTVSKAALGDITHANGDVDLKRLCTALGRLIRLQWRRGQLSGEVAVHVTTDSITAKMSSLVLPPKVRLRHALVIDGQHTDPGQRSVACPVHKGVQLCISVTNISRGLLQPSTVSVLSVQTGDTGTIIPTHPLSLLPIGSASATVPALQPGETYRHTLGFQCLARGRYIISYLCDLRGGVEHTVTQEKQSVASQEVTLGRSTALEVTR